MTTGSTEMATMTSTTPSIESAIPGMPDRSTPIAVMEPTHAIAPMMFQVTKRR